MKNLVQTEKASQNINFSVIYPPPLERLRSILEPINYFSLF